MDIKKFIKLGGAACSRELMISKLQSGISNAKVIHLAGLLWDLLVSTHYLKDIAYLHLVEGLTYDDIVQKLDVTYNSVRTTIYREKKRVAEDISDNVFDYIESKEYTTKQTEAFITVLEKLLQMQEERLEKKSLLDKLNIPMDSYVYNRDNELDDLEFVKLMKDLSVLSQPYARKVVDMAGDDLMGYIKYLLGSDEKYLNKRDRDRREQLIQSWWLNV